LNLSQKYFFETTSNMKKQFFSLLTILGIVVVFVPAVAAAALTAAIVIVFLLLNPLFIYLWGRVYRFEPLHDEIHWAETADGWRIAIHYHRPAEALKGAHPVVLAHGILNNARGFELDREHGLAYFLKERGFHVFVINFRGAGESRRCTEGDDDFTFDDMVENDIPAVLAKVRELTDATKVNWVGHSMGAMTMYGFLGRKLPGAKDVALLISLGGIGRLDHLRGTAWGSLVEKFPRLMGRLDVKFIAMLFAPFLARFDNPVERVIYNPKNFPGTDTFRRIYRHASDGTSPGLIRQMRTWLLDNRMLTADGAFDYRDGYRNITVPSLFIAGAGDNMGLVDAVRFVHDRSRSRAKDLRVIGREHGHSLDYCHASIIFGDRIALDIFPLVLDWLMRYGRRPGRSKRRSSKK